MQNIRFQRIRLKKPVIIGLKRQTAVAQEQGMSNDEIHDLFKYIMDMDIDAVEKSGTEETYETFRRAYRSGYDCFG